MKLNDLNNSPPPIDSALICLVLLARFHQIAIEPEQIKHQYADAGGVLAEVDILLAAKQAGLKVKAINTRVDKLERTPLPAMAGLGDSGESRGRCCALSACTGQAIAMQSAGMVKPVVWAFDFIYFARQFGG